MSQASQPSKNTPPPFIKVMGSFLVLFNLLVAGLAGWIILQSRRHQIDRAEITTHNLAEVLEKNVVGTLRQIDLVVQAVEDEAEHDSKGPRLDVLIQTQFNRARLLGRLQIADQEGRITHGMPATAPRTSVTGRDFFLHLKQGPDSNLYISRPFQESPSGTWNLALARRLDGKQGGFAGVVFAYLPLDQLTQILSRLNIGRHGSVSLRGADLSLLARYPGYQGQDTMIGDQTITGDYLKAVRAGQPSAQFTARSILDGTARIYTLQRTENFGFYLLVGLAQWEALGTWKYQAAFAALTSLGLAALTLTIGWQSRAAWRRHQAHEARLAAQEAKYRLLAENALDVVWTMDPHGNLTYVSPSIQRQRGWTVEEFMSLDPGMRMLSGDYASLVQQRISLVPQLPPGSQPFENDLFQAAVKRKDGQEIQVEAQWRVVWGKDGAFLGFQGLTRDVTERKLAEGERDQVILELSQALAEVKALSGMLPICSHCKKVRDDQGYWNQIETYLSKHTEATFTHGICPACAAQFREEMQARRADKDHGASE